AVHRNGKTVGATRGWHRDRVSSGRICAAGVHEHTVVVSFDIPTWAGGASECNGRGVVMDDRLAGEEYSIADLRAVAGRYSPDTGITKQGAGELSIPVPGDNPGTAIHRPQHVDVECATEEVGAYAEVYGRLRSRTHAGCRRVVVDDQGGRQQRH